MHCTRSFFTAVGSIVGFLSIIPASNATLISIDPCAGANECVITTTPPNPVSPNPNDGILLAWDERQNIELDRDLVVDRVFDSSAPFIEISGSDFVIKAGTIVSSHYLQWDPGNGSSSTVTATIALDSQVFAFITDDQNLFDSDFLGLPGLDYSDFRLRGLESGDVTSFNGENTDIRWTASNPGDWTRLITAFSPSATPVPVPSTLLLMAAGLFAARRAWRPARGA